MAKGKKCATKGMKSGKTGTKVVTKKKVKIKAKPPMKAEGTEQYGMQHYGS